MKARIAILLTLVLAVIGIGLGSASPAQADSVYTRNSPYIQCDGHELSYVASFGYQTSTGARKVLAGTAALNDYDAVTWVTAYANWSGPGQHYSNGPTNFSPPVHAGQDSVPGSWGSGQSVYAQIDVSYYIDATHNGSCGTVRINSYP